MRNHLLAALAAAAFYVVPGVGAAVGQSSNDGLNRWMSVKNLSRYTATNIYIIPSKRDCCWSRDLLEGQEIREKQSFFVDFDIGTSECEFDIRVVSSGFLAPNQETRFKEWNFDRINVCRKVGIGLKGDRDGRDRNMTVTNNSRFIVEFIYMRPAKRNRRADDWSFDLLGNEVIMDKEAIKVDFDDGTGACVVDLRFLGRTRDSQRKEWKFRGIDVCQRTSFTLN